MNIKALEQFLESVPDGVMPLISISDCEAWMMDEGEQSVIWVSMDSTGEYLEGYSQEIAEGYDKSDTHLIVNLDTGCGMWQTEIFALDKLLSEDEFYEKYDEYM